MSEVSNGRTGKRECLPAEPPSSSPSSFSSEVAEGLLENTLYDSFESKSPSNSSLQIPLTGLYDQSKPTLVKKTKLSQSVKVFL